MVSGYPTFTSIPWVDGLSKDPRGLGRHTPSRRSVATRIAWKVPCKRFVNPKDDDISLSHILFNHDPRFCSTLILIEKGVGLNFPEQNLIPLSPNIA